MSWSVKELDDKRTYEVLKSDPIPKYKKKLVGKLQVEARRQDNASGLWSVISDGREYPQDVLHTENP